LSSFYKGVALVLLSASGFALMSIFAIFAYREGVNIVTLLCLRFSLSAVAMFAYLAATRRSLAVSRRQLALLFVLGGVFYTSQATFYFSALRYISASLTGLLLYTFPFFVALLAAAVDKEKLTRANMLAFALAMAGLVFVLGASQAAVDLTGVLLALAAAVFYSAYIIVSNRVVKELSPSVIGAFVFGCAALVMLAFGTATGQLNLSLSPTAWLAVAGIVAFSTVMAILALFRGLELIGPTRASILSMIEPLVTFAFASLLFGDRFTAVQLAGGAAVLAGAVIVVKVRGDND
jgi:drug/metabolite transporter (DMT)-like permease